MKNINGPAISWNEQKAKLKQKLSVLTDSNVLLAAEKNDGTLGRLEIKLGKTKTELAAIIAAI